jgi:hypothetical protein
MAVLPRLDAATYVLPVGFEEENAILAEIYAKDLASASSHDPDDRTEVKKYLLDLAVEHANRYRSMTHVPGAGAGGGSFANIAGFDVSPFATGPLFYARTVKTHLRALFPTPGKHLGDSDVLCKHAIVHILKDNLDLIIAFCINSLVTCKAGINTGYLIYSIFNALNIDNMDGDIVIQVSLIDYLTEDNDQVVPFVPGSHSGSTVFPDDDVPSTDSVYTAGTGDTDEPTPAELLANAANPVVMIPKGMRIPTHTMKLRKALLENPDTSDHVISEFLDGVPNADKIKILSRSTVGFIAAHRGESQSPGFETVWSVKLICTYLDLLNEVQGSGQGLLAIFLISIILKGGIKACLELARLFLNITGLCAYSKLGFVPNVDQLLLAPQRTGQLFNDPANLQMSVDLSGPIGGAPATRAQWVEEIKQRFSGASARTHKHEVCSFRQVQCDLPNWALFHNAPSGINNLQVEAAVVSIMRNHLHIMTTCLGHLGTEWRSELRDLRGNPYTYQNLYNSAKQGLAPLSFGGLFDETNRFEYHLYQGRQTSCYARVAAFYAKVNEAHGKGNKLRYLIELERKLASHYDALLAANMDMQWSTPSIKFVDPSAPPGRVILRAWNTRAQRLNARDARATDRAMAWRRDQAPLGSVMEQQEGEPGGEATWWESDFIPSITSNTSDGPLIRTGSAGTLATEPDLRWFELDQNAQASTAAAQPVSAVSRTLSNKSSSSWPSRITAFLGPDPTTPSAKPPGSNVFSFKPPSDANPSGSNVLSFNPSSALHDPQTRPVKRTSLSRDSPTTKHQTTSPSEGGKKQTKNKRKKNKPKTKRRAANKKNKKAQHQQHAGRVSGHKRAKVFRNKTRKSN